MTDKSAIVGESSFDVIWFRLTNGICVNDTHLLLAFYISLTHTHLHATANPSLALYSSMSCLDFAYFLHHFQGNIMITTGYYFIQDILQCKCHILIMYLFGSVSNIILRAFCHTDFSSLGLHREITLVYFFAIPMILYYLSKPVILVFIEIDRLSTCKKPSIVTNPSFGSAIILQITINGNAQQERRDAKEGSTSHSLCII